MKKDFVIPEIKAFELYAKDVVMNSALAGQNTYANYNITDFSDYSEISDEYNMWKGKDCWI